MEPDFMPCSISIANPLIGLFNSAQLFSVVPSKENITYTQTIRMVNKPRTASVVLVFHVEDEHLSWKGGTTTLISSVAAAASNNTDQAYSVRILSYVSRLFFAWFLADTVVTTNIMKPNSKSLGFNPCIPKAATPLLFTVCAKRIHFQLILLNTGQARETSCQSPSWVPYGLLHVSYQPAHQIGVISGTSHTTSGSHFDYSMCHIMNTPSCLYVSASVTTSFRILVDVILLVNAHKVVGYMWHKWKTKLDHPPRF
ncbi:hypothetical protein HanRHA438_Chr09g0428311 [Helianthus annuus]|nr:hypothetical protein HanRHA438_Chr09g0428311 [Helianthus annuus]